MKYQFEVFTKKKFVTSYYILLVIKNLKNKFSLILYTAYVALNFLCFGKREEHACGN